MNMNPYDNLKFIVDIEATCYENPKQPDLNEIIEIGIVLCDADYNIIYEWSSLVKPKVNKNLSGFCKRLTRITQEEIDIALDFVDVMKIFQSDFETKYGISTNALIWCSWGDWDLKCLVNNCERNSIQLPFGGHKNLRSVYVDKKNDGVNNKCGLREVYRKENIGELPKHHRALIDAVAAAKIAKLLHEE